MKLIAFLLRQSKRTVILAIFAGLVSGACNTGLLALMNRAIQGGVLSRGALLWPYVGLCALVPLTRIASELLLLRLGQKSVYDLRLQLSRRILAVPLRHLEKLGAARLNGVLTGDVPAIAGAVGLLPLLAINFAILAGCLVYLGLLSFPVLLAILGFLGLGILGYRLPSARALQHFQRAVQARDVLYAHFRAMTEGTKELKLHSRRRDVFLNETLRDAALDQRVALVDGQTLYTLAASWGQLLVFVVLGLLLFAAPRLLPGMAGREVLTGYGFALLYMMAPLQVLLASLPNLGQAEASLRRVEETGLDLGQHASEEPAAVAPEGVAWRSLELRGVTHAYHREGREGEERDFVLGPIDLALAPGELVFLVGGNGSGKTTFAKVLVGLYPPEGGEIRFNGEPVTDRNRELYRQHFSVVFADFFLFEQLLGLAPGDLDSKARQYLTELQLDHKVTIAEGRLSTTDLSQGQRKRLALLTAYLEDRPILVFDEWAADQDPYFKDVFYLHLLPELKKRGKTVVVITHDDRYFHLGDRLLRLDYGRMNGEPPRVSPQSIEPSRELAIS